MDAYIFLYINQAYNICVYMFLLTSFLNQTNLQDNTNE